MTKLQAMTELVSDISKLSKTLQVLAGEMTDAIAKESAPDPAKKGTKKKSDTVAPASTGESSSTENSSTEPETFTIEQVRAVLAEKSQAGLTAKVKELLTSFGANKLSAVKPEDYAALMEAARELR